MPQVDITPDLQEDKSDQSEADALARLEQGGILEGNKSTGEPAKEAAPEWCPEKYARFNADGTFNASEAAQEMAKGMDHLNKMATQNRQGETNDDADDKPANDFTGDDAPLTTPELWQSFTEEYAEKGDLGPESRKIIQDLGIPPAMVDDYIEGQKARAGAWQQSATSVLGENGDAEYETLIDWADQAMTAEQSKTFNDAVTSGDLSRAQMAIRDLKNQYISAEGSYENILQGGRSGSTGVQPFNSRYEMTEAINDVRYSKDSAYRAQVEKRIGATQM